MYDGAIVLIIGRPNVGKSTLFNRLAGRPAAVVFNRPGVTRDLLEAELTLGNDLPPVRLMDSAGWPYPGDDLELNEKINQKVQRALKTSKLILWVVEGPAGRTGAEDAFAERLQAYRKKTILVINKIDELARPSSKWAETEFSGLPWDAAVPITAKHGRGISDLLSVLEDRLRVEPEEREPESESEKPAVDDHILRLSILGRPNVGKSTLVNRLLKQDRVVVSDRPGTTRDAVETLFEHNGRPVLLIDTAGVRRIDRITDGLERTTSKIALQTGQGSNVTILMMDISQGLAEQDLRLLTYLWGRGVTSIAAANKWDLLTDRSSDDAQLLETEFRRRAHEAQEVPFVRISAKTGHGLGHLLDTAFALYEASHQKIRTPTLNKNLQEWNSEMPTGLFRDRPGKLKYAVQTHTAPLTFKIFVNNPKFFRNETIHYLEKRFRQAFGLHGIPIALHLVKSE